MGTWIVGAVVLIIIGLAGYKVIKDRRNGKACGGCCDGCQSCHESGNGKTP